MRTRKLDARQIACAILRLRASGLPCGYATVAAALVAILRIMPCVQTRKRPSADAERRENAAHADISASSNATRLLCFRELQRRPKAASVSVRDGGPKAGRAGKTRPCEARAKRLCGAASRASDAVARGFSVLREAHIVQLGWCFSHKDHKRWRRLFASFAFFAAKTSLICAGPVILRL